LLGVGFPFGKLDVSIDVANQRAQLGVGGKLVFGAFALFQDALCFFLIVPEIGVGDAFFGRLQARAILRGVKGSSARD
jgi:hypothetical protein